MPGPVSMRTLYLRRGMASPFSAGCVVLHVTPFLRELIVEAVRLGQLRTRNRHERALRDLLILHLKPHRPCRLLSRCQRTPSACDRRGCDDNPAQLKPLAALCANVGVSVRTIERAFRKRRRHRFRIVAPPGPADESRGAPGFGMFDQRGRLRGWLSPIQRIRGNVPANFWNHSEGMGLSSRETGLKSKKKPR